MPLVLSPFRRMAELRHTVVSARIGLAGLGRGMVLRAALALGFAIVGWLTYAAMATGPAQADPYADFVDVSPNIPVATTASDATERATEPAKVAIQGVSNAPNRLADRVDISSDDSAGRFSTADSSSTMDTASTVDSVSTVDSASADLAAPDGKLDAHRLEDARIEAPRFEAPRFEGQKLDAGELPARVRVASDHLLSDRSLMAVGHALDELTGLAGLFDSGITAGAVDSADVRPDAATTASKPHRSDVPTVAAEFGPGFDRNSSEYVGADSAASKSRAATDRESPSTPMPAPIHGAPALSPASTGLPGFVATGDPSGALFAGGKVTEPRPYDGVFSSVDAGETAVSPD